MKRYKIFIATGIFLSAIAQANSDLIPVDPELESLLQLDLEELTSVSVASKRSESIQDAPGIVTLITAEEIKRYGYRNLRDILDRQTHMQIVGSNSFPHTRISLRASTFTHTDNTVLPLLNGRPIRDAASVSNNHDLYSAFPVEAIKQIEIIRGPGSVLYGTNAFTGVINIITKDAPTDAEGTAAFTFGSFDTIKGAFSGGVQSGDFEIFGAINTFDTDGENFNNLTDQFGTLGTYKTGEDGQSAVLQARYKGFTVNSLFTDVSQDHVRVLLQFPSDDIDTQRQYVDIGYKHNLTDNWSVSANALYHHFNMDFLFNAAGSPTGLNADNVFVEFTTHASPVKGLSLLAGGSYNELDGLLKNTGKTYNTHTISAYAQADYWLFEWLKLTGGIQYNEPEGKSGDYSPRFGAIAHITDEWGVKLLYGEAFREPSPIDKFLRTPCDIWPLP